MTDDGFKKMLAILYSVHPQLEPKKATRNFVYQAWFKMLSDIPDEKIMGAAYRFITEIPEIYPGCSFIAHIRQLANPQLTETEGDCIQLAFDAVREFGYMRESDAMEWIKERSDLVASVVKRIGFRELCMCETPDVIRGQMRSLFKSEKERAIKHGVVVASSADLKNGLPDKRTCKLLKDAVEKTKLKLLETKE